MTIATSLFYDRAKNAMGALSARADTLNTQLSTQKKFAAPSDDPLAYSRLRGLATQTADSTAYAGNLQTASSVLSTADTTLTSIRAQITHAQELAVQANNGTLSDANKKAIAEELTGIVQTLGSLANVQDTRGQPLFGDATGGPAVATGVTGTRTFASGSVPAIPIADGQSVQPSVSAAAIFQFGGTDTFTTIETLASALNAGGDLGTAGSDAIAKLDTAGGLVDTAQASIGARGARVELEQSTNTAAATDREALRSTLEDTDYTSTIVELQKTMTTLQATQASFTKLQSLSLFDYLK